MDRRFTQDISQRYKFGLAILCGAMLITGGLLMVAAATGGL